MPEGFDDEELPGQAGARGARRALRRNCPTPSTATPTASGWSWSSASSRRCGFSGYFLIVQDFINWAKRKGIPVGPGRGSGAGSIVAYALRITDLDPIRYNLLFERFLNPERVSMPDFDVDFCQNRRGEVIDYVTDKYGKDNVGQIITFGSLKARSVIRDVVRVRGLPFAEGDQLPS